MCVCDWSPTDLTDDLKIPNKHQQIKRASFRMKSATSKVVTASDVSVVVLAIVAGVYCGIFSLRATQELNSRLNRVRSPLVWGGARGGGFFHISCLLHRSTVRWPPIITTNGIAGELLPPPVSLWLWLEFYSDWMFGHGCVWRKGWPSMRVSWGIILACPQSNRSFSFWQRSTCSGIYPSIAYTSYWQGCTSTSPTPPMVWADAMVVLIWC